MENKELTKRDFKKNEIEYVHVDCDNTYARLRTDTIYTCKDCDYAVMKYDSTSWYVISADTFEIIFSSLKTFQAAISAITLLMFYMTLHYYD